MYAEIGYAASPSGVLRSSCPTTASPLTLARTTAHPTRRRILAQLAQGDRCVTRLARRYAISLPAVSKHLRVLEKAGYEFEGRMRKSVTKEGQTIDQLMYAKIRQ